MQPETVPVYAFYADPAEEFASVDGFLWYWDKSSAQGAYGYAGLLSCHAARTLSLFEVLVPVDVIREGRMATTRFIDECATHGPARLLSRRPPITPAA